MRIVVPVTTINVETVAALVNQGPVDFIDVSRSVESYWNLLSELWRRQEDFIVVEQDIVVNETTIPSFHSCPHRWCTAGYPYLRSQSYHGLGCCRFRKAVMVEHPFVMDDVAQFCYPGHCEKHWCTLDAALQRQFAFVHEGRCDAHRTVGHLHDRPTHGCVPGYED